MLLIPITLSVCCAAYFVSLLSYYDLTTPQANSVIITYIISNVFSVLHLYWCVDCHFFCSAFISSNLRRLYLTLSLRFTFLYLPHWLKPVLTSSSSSISRDFLFRIRKYSNPISLASSSRWDFLCVVSVFFPHFSHVATVMLDGRLYRFCWRFLCLSCLCEKALQKLWLLYHCL